MFIQSAEWVEYKQADGTLGKYILIRIPFRSLAFYTKVADKMIEHLESKFKWPVMISASRVILSKNGKQTRSNFLSHPPQEPDAPPLSHS